MSWEYFNEAKYVNNGDWTDPHLEYRGKIFNYYHIEDTIYESFKEYAEENKIVKSEDNFKLYCNENQDYIREILEELT